MRSATSPAPPTVYTVTTGDRTNVRGRYAVHFHRGGVDPNSTPAQIVGSVVDGSPGWGLVNHSANVNMIDNVAYGVQGAAFYTEVGDEIGSMVGNIAIRTVSPSFRLGDEGAIDPDLRADRMDFGVDGDGFWLSGHMVSMQGNVSAGASGHGIIIWSDGVIEPDLERGRSSVQVAHVENGHLITGRDTIPTWWAPLAAINNNESYGATIGFRSRYVHSQGYLGEIGSAFHTPPDQAYIDTLQPTIDGLTVWGSRDGVLMNYNERMSIRNARLIGIGAPYVQNGGTADTGVGIDMYNEVTRGPGVIENVSIEGFQMGLLAPRQDHWRVNNVQLSNTTDMLITEVIEAPRTLEMTNVRFGSLDGTAVADQAANRHNIVMRAFFDANPLHPFHFLMSDRITLDGQQLYFNEQAADFVPTAGEIAASPGPVPGSMIGLTNQQLVDRFGTSFGGAIIPEGAARVDSLIGGVAGDVAPPAATSPPIYHPAGESAGPNSLIIDPGTLTNFDGPVPDSEEDDEPSENDDTDDDQPDGAEDDENDACEANHQEDDADSETDDEEEDVGDEEADDEESDDSASEDDSEEDGAFDEEETDGDDEEESDDDSESESDDEETAEDSEPDDDPDPEDDDSDGDEDEAGEEEADEDEACDADHGDDASEDEDSEDGDSDDGDSDDGDDQEESDDEDDSGSDSEEEDADEADSDDVPPVDDEDAGADSESDNEGDEAEETKADEVDPDFHNDRSPTDVNDDGLTTALDALLVINFLRSHGQQFLQTLSMALQAYVDVNNDDAATALDALQIINAIANGRQNQGQAEAVDNVIQSMDLDREDEEDDPLAGLAIELR